MAWLPAPGRISGLGLAAMSAALWAIGGIAAQDLFSRHHVDPGWLAGVRMACGGLLLLVAFRPAWPRRQEGLLIAVAVLGIAGAQYTWFAAIDKSNVALATFVQYSAVPMTAGWQMLRGQVRPTARRLAAVAAAGTGVWLLAAGVPGGLRASRADQAGVALAVVSAVAFSFYLLGSARLVRDVGARPTTAWGLAIGSIPLLAWFPPWTAHPSGDPLVVAGLTAIVAVAATAVAFSLSLASLRRITPTEFAVTSTLEPALAAVAAAVFLGVTLRAPQYAGGALTMIAVLLLVAGGRPGGYGRRVIDLDQSWSTERLELEPLTVEHAAELAPVLDDAALHEFTGGAPLAPAALTARFALLAERRSPDGHQLWGNWVMRVRGTSMAVGTMQVTLPAGGPTAGPAEVAWVVGPQAQGRGYAKEAASGLVALLRKAGWTVVAHIHPAHLASQRVARAAGLSPTGEVHEGEVRWVIPSSAEAEQAMFVIRAAVPGDMSALRDVFRRSSLSNDRDRANLLAHPDVLELSDLAVREGRTRAAVAGDRVVGFATWLGTGNIIEIEDLFVDPERMRQGIGRALVLDLIAIAHGHGVRRVEVTANRHALAFYETTGFVVDHKVTTMFGPAPRMHMDLPPAGGGA